MSDTVRPQDRYRSLVGQMDSLTKEIGTTLGEHERGWTLREARGLHDLFERRRKIEKQLTDLVGEDW